MKNISKIGSSVKYLTLMGLTYAAVTLGGGIKEAKADDFVETRVTSPSADLGAEIGTYLKYISGDKIVWCDRRNNKTDIYMWDSINGEQQITFDSKLTFGNPSISRDTIVWSEWRNNKSNIYMLDSTNGEQQIISDSFYKMSPYMSNNKVVWKQGSYGTEGIFMWDSINGKQQINNSSSYKWYPCISKNRVAWLDYSKSDSWTIRTWNPIKGEQILSTTPTQWGPVNISEDRIVWVDNRNSNSDVYIWDSVNGEQQITSDSANQYAPSISGNKIVWVDDRNGNYDIYMHDISTEQETQITNHPANQYAPNISGLNVAWYDTRDRENGFDIYMTKIPGPIKCPIDIKPGSCPNPLNVKSRGKGKGKSVLPVAVLGTEDFDVSEIDISSIRLAGIISPYRRGFEDVATYLVEAGDCECWTEGPDGYTDLTLKFDRRAIIEAIGQVNNKEVLILELTGALHDGTPIEGRDCVVIRGNSNSKNKNK